VTLVFLTIRGCLDPPMRPAPLGSAAASSFLGLSQSEEPLGPSGKVLTVLWSSAWVLAAISAWRRADRLMVLGYSRAFPISRNLCTADFFVVSS
jgi:hypothetical protein